jgi:hypothetical protein
MAEAYSFEAVGWGEMDSPLAAWPEYLIKETTKAEWDVCQGWATLA